MVGSTVGLVIGLVLGEGRQGMCIMPSLV